MRGLPHFSYALRHFVSVGLFLAASSASLGQDISVGDRNPIYAGSLNPSGVETVFQISGLAANADGVATTAVFGWSNSPCPAAVKIKFFRPEPVVGVSVRGASFLTERGPFDVTQPLSFSGPGPPVTQTVILSPPVQLRRGDIIAITNLTSCGGPTFVREILSPLPLRSSVAVPGDIVFALLLPDPPYKPAVFAAAFGSGPTLELLGRFRVGLVATDPRTGRQTGGSPVLLTRSAGYFSLPDFTGDSTFPEVMVKMVDATGTPSLGGTFWFFHSPLTDVQYTITVTDLRNGSVRTYRNASASASPGQLCGGVDTSAFRP